MLRQRSPLLGLTPDLLYDKWTQLRGSISTRYHERIRDLSVLDDLGYVVVYVNRLVYVSQSVSLVDIRQIGN